MSENLCHNYNFCLNTCPEYRNICLNCYAMFGNLKLSLLIIEENCPVCYENIKEHIKFPGCEHSVCILCFKKLYCVDETNFHINPVLYGCSPCPNHTNPNEGTQCYCEDYDKIIKEWKTIDPDNYNLWQEDEYYNVEKNLENQNSGKCVLCRAPDPPLVFN